ncbi:uncharacterized protein LOC143010303 [Genypterus blacodes]|uniref:uncharacterized protein LOC143010303 n=1 Tax=Genypterus blacodes TaxID=154954 RepID=UPI003F75B238
MRKRKGVKAGENCSPVTVANGAHLKWSSEEVLLPFFTDESLQVAMNTELANTHGSLPELRLVLLGRKGTGKSSACNTVLAGAGGFESGKPTEECVKMSADVVHRRVTVVDTPGWEWYYPLNNTPNWVRQETLRSVTLCPPGPHAVLLVLRACASVTESYIEEIEEHLEPLGEGVWEHTMMLFTRGDELGLVSMEQRILTSGPALRKLLQKCGTRYHVLDNRSRGDGTQVKELIRKLVEMVDGKEEGHEYFEVENTALLGLEADRKRRARETRRKQRQMEAQVQRRSIKAALTSDCVQGYELDARQSFSKAPRHLPEVRLVLLGERETGKSSAGNTILGGGRFFQARVTEECARQQEEVALRLVTVVDTPGWEGGAAGVTTERVKREIVGSVVLCPPGPHALLLNLRVDTLVKAGHVREHLKLLGEGVWRHTILLFTHGDQLRVGVNIEQHIKSGGRDLQWLLEKCKGRYHVISSVEAGGRASGGSAQVTELLEKVEKMAAGNRCEAFSELVQEVRDLSRQRNEKFHQRLKDMSDKMLRQEAELKKLRDREVRSFGRLFDRRKKGKSPGNADVEREEEEDGERRNSERSNENSDLEERMRWLMEDKEREIQDLRTENDRILTALHQNRREREEALLRLEQKEREIGELRERIDEQKPKLLELEQTIVENEHERKQWVQGGREREEGWVREVERCTEEVEQHMREKAEWVEKVNSLKAEMEERKKHWDDVVLEAQEKKREMEGEIKRKVAELKEKEKELHKKEEDIEAIKLQHREEMAEKVKEIEKGMRVQHEGVDRKLKEREEEFERVKQQHEDELRKVERGGERDIEELRQGFERLLQEREKEKADIEEKHLRQIQEKMLQSEKEKEMIQISHRKEIQEKMQDREKEEEALKALLEQRARKVFEIENVRSQHRKEINRKQREEEEEVEKVKQQCGNRINDVEKEREEEIKELRRQFAIDTEGRLQEKEREMAEIGRKYADEMEEREQQKEKEKERVNANHKEQMQEKERENAEIRLKVKEVQERLQQKEERERDYKRGMEERERETEEMRQRVKDIEGILQRKEEDTRETVLHQEEEAEQRLRKREGEVEEMRAKLLGDAERKVKERESEVEIARCQAEARWREEQRQRDERQEREMTRLIEVADSKGEEIAQREGEIEEAKKTSDGYLKEIDRLRETIQNQNSSVVDIQRHHTERERSREALMMERLGERDKEIEELRRRDRENESEVAQLRQTIQQTRSELTGLTEKMEKEMTSMIREYEGEIARRDDSAEMVAKEKEEFRREVEAQISDYKSREEEVREHLSRYEGEVKNKEAEIQILCKERDLEVRALKQMIDKLETEIDRMKERESEREKRLEEMKEIQRANLRNEAIGEEFLKRGRELGEREENLSRKEEEVRKRGYKLDAEEEELVEKEGKLEARERECRRQETNLEREQQQREEQRKSDQDLTFRAESVEKKERELENLLRALESKQQELNVHGQELEKKVKGLKHRGKGLEERESELKSEEQELLSLRSELQVRGERLDAEMQQLNDMGRDLAALQEELCAREVDLKVVLERLREQERGLEEREEELRKREQNHANKTTEVKTLGRDLCNGRERGRASMGELSIKHQGLGADGQENRGKGGGRDSDPVPITDREDQRVKPAASATESVDYQLETLKERKMREETEGVKGKTIEGAKVARDFNMLSPSQGHGISKNKGSPGSDLKVLVLGETWSSRHPAGVTILSGEPLQPDGSSLRRWKVQIAGRRLTIAEPAGLKWRDGPDPTATSQQQGILDSASWEPHAILLVVPAFLTFTRKCRKAMEEHVSLLGEEVWGRTLVVLTWGETLGESAQQHFLRNGELMTVVERCGGRFHVLTSKKNKRLTEGLLEKIEDVVDLKAV